MGDWKEKARDRAKEMREGESFKLTEGDNTLRVMPNKKGLKFPPYKEIMVHREVGPDNGFCRCGKALDGTGSCWLCDKKIPQLNESESRQKRMKADAMAPQRQMVAQVSRVNPETSKFGKPKPWWISTGGPSSLSVKFLSLISKVNKSYDDPKKGYNLNVERTGSGMKTRYPTGIVHEDSPSVVPLAVLQQIKSFDELLPKYSEEEQKALYLGQKREDIRKAAADDDDDAKGDDNDQDSSDDSDEGSSGDSDNDQDSDGGGDSDSSDDASEADSDSDEGGGDSSDDSNDSDGDADAEPDEDEKPKNKDKKKDAKKKPAADDEDNDVNDGDESWMEKPADDEDEKPKGKDKPKGKPVDKKKPVKPIKPKKKADPDDD